MSAHDLMRMIAVAIVIYSVAPFLILWLAVRVYPRGHDRRRELLHEYSAWRVRERPFRALDVAASCVVYGAVARRRDLHLRRATGGFIRGLEEHGYEFARDEDPRFVIGYSTRRHSLRRGRMKVTFKPSGVIAANAPRFVASVRRNPDRDEFINALNQAFGSIYPDAP